MEILEQPQKVLAEATATGAMGTIVVLVVEVVVVVVRFDTKHTILLNMMFNFYSKTKNRQHKF